MRILLTVVGFLIVGNSFCQNDNARDILSKSYERCNSIHAGYCEFIERFKPMTSMDTTIRKHNCYFKKVIGDTIFPAIFHHNLFIDDTLRGGDLYTGDAFYDYRFSDSTGTVRAVSKWREEIESIKHNIEFYSPIITSDSYPLIHDSLFNPAKHFITYVREEKVSVMNCHRLNLNIKVENDSNSFFNVLNQSIDFWISDKDMMLVKYSVSIDLVVQNDTMNQYHESELINYDLDNIKVSHMLEVSSIPKYIKLKDFMPSSINTPELLSPGTMAPLWTLESLTGDSISLVALRGKVVLLDFFYKSCYPCMLALPDLQSLHEKYNNDGLVVIGINPVDKRESGIAEFLSKRNITYTVVLEGKQCTRDYNVSGYPSMYIIDKEGNIVYSESGYGAEGKISKIEGIIKKQL